MKNYIRCKKCGSCINIDTKNQYIKCACGAIAVDGNEYDTRIIGEKENWEYVVEKEG